MKFIKLFAAVLLGFALQLSADISNLINDLNKTLSEEDRKVFQILIALQLKIWKIELENQFNENLTVEGRKKLEDEYNKAGKESNMLQNTRSDLSRRAIEIASLKIHKELIEQKIIMCKSILDELKRQNNDK